MSGAEDKFEKLERKLRQVVEVFKRTQAEKRALEQQLERLKAGSKQGPKGSPTLEKELLALRREREDVRSRIEKLVRQIELLTKPDSAG